MPARSYIITLLLLSGLFLVRCGGNKPPQDLIPPKKYEKLIVEFQLLKSYQSMFEDSAKTAKVRQKILNHYHITLAQFKRSHEYYKLNQKAEHQRLKQALDQINEERDRVWNVKSYHNHKVPKSRKIPKTKPKGKNSKSGSQSSDK